MPLITINELVIFSCLLLSFYLAREGVDMNVKDWLPILLSILNMIINILIHKDEQAEKKTTQDSEIERQLFNQLRALSIQRSFFLCLLYNKIFENSKIIYFFCSRLFYFLFLLYMLKRWQVDEAACHFLRLCRSWICVPSSLGASM